METIITASPVFRLRDPEHERQMAIIHKSTAPTANLIIQRLMSDLFAWHVAGNVFETHDQLEIDFQRMETLGEQFVYDIKGKAIFLMRDVPLVRMDDCWGKNSRRTMNRLLEKIDRPSHQLVAFCNLSRMFWLDVHALVLEESWL
ncbi:hypothetical protein A9Q94_06520 [Rhodobacterales bacterium 56_14_T64]|nr:hypothetical protein A9Q94_06520 [Rhodobacterales bacterium 56_14_T64]